MSLGHAGREALFTSCFLQCAPSEHGSHETARYICTSGLQAVSALQPRRAMRQKWRTGCPPTGHVGRFCLLCFQPEPIPVSLSARTLHLTARRPFRTRTRDRTDPAILRSAERRTARITHVTGMCGKETGRIPGYLCYFVPNILDVHRLASYLEAVLTVLEWMWGRHEGNLTYHVLMGLLFESILRICFGNFHT